MADSPKKVEARPALRTPSVLSLTPGGVLGKASFQPSFQREVCVDPGAVFSAVTAEWDHLGTVIMTEA